MGHWGNLGMHMARAVGVQSWIRLGLRRRLVRGLFPEGAKPETRFCVPFRGYRYEGAFSSNIDWQVFFFGGYEQAELDVIEEVTGAIDGCVSMDVGANTGQHTLVLARHSARVEAFEPFPPVRERALGHLERNRLDHVTVHPFGLATQARTATYLYNSRSSNLGTGSFVSGHNLGADTQVDLEIRRGDDWFDESGLTRLDFIKIDVEGFEAEVLAGLAATLAAHQPALMVEVTRTAAEGFDKHGGLRALLPYPASFYRILKPSPVAVVFSNSGYRLAPVDDPQPETASYNLLIVPERRAQALAGIIGARTVSA